VIGDLKQMSPEWLVAQSIRGYGCSLSVGLGIPIPILNEEILKYTAVSDDQIFTQIVDYGYDYPEGISRSYGQVSYAELKSGTIMIKGQQVSTHPLSSMVKARKIAEQLKSAIRRSKFLLGQPQHLFF
jgi:L-aspartate semialdehyde sulfurtransferase